MENGGQRPGQHSRVPGKDISKEKKTKKIKKNSRRGEAMSVWPLKKSQSQHEGMLKLQHMPKSPDPSSTFPRVQMPSRFFIVHLRPTSMPGKFVFSICIVFFSLAESLFQGLLTRPPCAPSIHLALPLCCPSIRCIAPKCKFFFFCCLAFADLYF